MYVTKNILLRMKFFKNYLFCFLVMLSLLTSAKQNIRSFDFSQLERVVKMYGSNIVSPPLS